MKEITATVRGRVQRVMFRDFTKRSAVKLGVFGTVQNIADGSVKVIAQGAQEALEHFVETLHKGSLLSRVDEVNVVWRDIDDVTFPDIRIVFNDSFIDKL